MIFLKHWKANVNYLKVNNLVILKIQFTIFWIQVAAVSVSHFIKLIALNAKGMVFEFRSRQPLPIVTVYMTRYNNRLCAISISFEHRNVTGKDDTFVTWALLDRIQNMLVLNRCCTMHLFIISSTLKNDFLHWQDVHCSPIIFIFFKVNSFVLSGTITFYVFEIINISSEAFRCLLSVNHFDQVYARLT